MNLAPLSSLHLSDDPPLEATRPVPRSPGSWMSGSGPEVNSALAVRRRLSEVVRTLLGAYLDRCF